MSPRAFLSVLPWSRLRALGARYVWLIGFMGAATLFSLKTGEHYPFSHFPMFGNPNSRPVDYYFLTDAAGQALPVAQRVGDTAPKLKKQINTALNEWGFSHNIRVKSLIPAEVRARLTIEVLNAAVQQSKERGTALPDRVQLWRGDITPTASGYQETFSMEAAN